jgi:hypothetical protein
MYKLRGNEELNSKEYFLCAKQYLICTRLSNVVEFTITDGNIYQYLSMIYIKSEYPPVNVKLTFNDQIFAECKKDNILLINNEKIYSEFIPDTFFRNVNDFGKTIGNLYKILLYRDTPNINRRPKDINTTSYFFPIGQLKFMEIKIVVEFENLPTTIITPSCRLEFMNTMPMYDMRTENNEKTKFIRFHSGCVGDLGENFSFDGQIGECELIDTITFCNTKD